MRQHKLAAIACLGVLVVCGTAWTAPQDRQQKPPDTSAEYSGYQAAHNENDAQTKIKLLDDFAAKDCKRSRSFQSPRTVSSQGPAAQSGNASNLCSIPSPESPNRV